MKNNIYESAYLNMIQNQKREFNINDILTYTTSINEFLIKIEQKFIEQQKMVNIDDSQQKLMNIQIGLDAINKIKEDISNINQKITVISDSLEKL